MIADITSCLPPGRLTNDDMAREFPDWPAEKIFEKTGIRSRRIAAEGTCASDLATEAAKILLARRPQEAPAPDFILFCTQSPDYFLPTTACLIQQRLGLPSTVGALDFNLGCSGYVYGLALASGLVAGGIARQILLLTADTYTRFLAPADRACRTIFGDAGTATLLSASSPRRMHSFVLGTDGTGAEQLIVRGGGLREPAMAPACLHMDGPEIYNFTLRSVPRLVAQVLAKAKLGADDIDYYVFHQANAYMLEALRRKIGIPAEKFVLCLEETGNTVSSTIPLALEHLTRTGALRAGARLMLVGFGVGFSWGGCIVEW